MSVVFGLSLVTNENVRGYQLQMKSDGNFPLDTVCKQIIAAKLRGEETVNLGMGSVVNIKHFKQMFYDIVQLERIGFRAVGRGSEYHPKMVLDEKKLNLEDEL